MAESLKKLTLKGFKSIESLVDFELRPLNILIGANGSGKSNLVDFFRMLRAMANEGLQSFVAERGGADGFFYMGPKQTPKISARLDFGEYAYEFDLAATVSSGIMFRRQMAQMAGMEYPVPGVSECGLREFQGALHSHLGETRAPDFFEAISNRTVYHFNDTSLLAPMRRPHLVHDRAALRDDASNIAPFLLKLREEYKPSYELVRDTVRQIAPFFDEFILEPKGGEFDDIVHLQWRQKGSDFPFQAYQLSDGMIRFICLATALLQPQPPATIVIDEPELGLHPFAIGLLANLIQSAAERTQVIVSTQSPTLLDQFNDPEDIIVVNREAGHSTFVRLKADDLKEWMEDYSVAELWQKDVLRGGPVNE